MCSSGRPATELTLSLGERVGSLEPGKQADLVVVNCRRANLVPTLRIVSAFVHNGQASDVEAWRWWGDG